MKIQCAADRGTRSPLVRQPDLQILKKHQIDVVRLCTKFNPPIS
jgi:hypothetical protein